LTSPALQATQLLSVPLPLYPTSQTHETAPVPFVVEPVAQAVHDVELPETLENVLIGQTTHALPLRYDPGGHTQFVEPGEETNPAGQAVHAVFPIDDLNVFAAQNWQFPSPLPVYPGLQTHAVEAVEPMNPFVVVLASHDVQFAAFPFVDLNVSIGQAEQAPRPVPKNPALHTHVD
jgi:hypothetical protein